MQVVDAQDERLVELLEGAAGLVRRPPLARREPAEGALAGGAQTREEAGRRRIRGLGRVPGAGAARVRRELREQGRLARSRRCHDEHEAVLLTPAAQHREALSTERLGARRARAPTGWRVSLWHVSFQAILTIAMWTRCGGRNRQAPRTPRDVGNRF